MLLSGGSYSHGVYGLGVRKRSIKVTKGELSYHLAGRARRINGLAGDAVPRKIAPALPDA
eukprot:7059684-Pyramimonas_sp.AAC.3